MSVYQEITSQIIDKLMEGVIPWQQPWREILGQAVSYRTGKPYEAVNQMLLLNKAGEYVTFFKAREEGHPVRKGEKATKIMGWAKKEETDKEGKKVTTAIFPVYRNVFHLDQTDGLKPKWSTSENAAQPVMKAEDIIKEYCNREGGIRIIHKDQSAYLLNEDAVSIPRREKFKSNELYYKTLFHQLAHSTARSARLDRSFDSEAFESNANTREELTAEICSAMLCSFAGIDSSSVITDAAAYIDKWIPALQEDPRMIVWASSRAEKAARYILGIDNNKENSYGTENI